MTQVALDALEKQLGSRAQSLSLPKVVVEMTPSGAPSIVFTQSLSVEGKPLPDGFYTEWYAEGSLKRYAEYVQGKQHGSDVKWDQEGRILSEIRYDRGEAVEK